MMVTRCQRRCREGNLSRLSSRVSDFYFFLLKTLLAEIPALVKPLNTVIFCKFSFPLKNNVRSLPVDILWLGQGLY